MYNVLIFGTGVTSKIVISNLKKDVNIIAFIDNDFKKWSKIIQGRNIISPNEISEFKYDYIIIASEYNEEIYNQLLKLGINNKKILQFCIFNDLKNNYIKEKLLKERNNSKVKGIITGISYTSFGIKEKELKNEFLNLAFPSQDLFYDYELAKYVIKKNFYQIKYVIIGLSYYSFQYDLSLSSMKHKVILYNDILNNHHNTTNCKKINDNYKISLTIAKNIFNDTNNIKVDNSDDLITQSNKNLLGKKQATIDCNKNYDKTLKENIQIFKNYLEMLKVNGIKPIITVVPASKYYTEWFDKRIELEFKNIIELFRKEYDFDYLDYFRSKLFDDDDFLDVSHLSEKGAIKFTKMLNKDIIL